MLLQTITAVIVAVAPIQVEPYEDTKDWAPTVYEHLTNSIANYAIVVERDQLENIINEQNLGMSGLIDESTAAKVGKLLGANYVIISKITGKVYSLQERTSHSIYIEMSSRIVDVETGRAIRGLTVSGEYMGKRQADALSKAAKDLSYQIAIGLLQKYPVVVKRSWHTVYINRGGLPKGAILTAWEDMGEYHKKTGEVEIIESYDTWSEGRIVEGNVKEGNLLNPNVNPVKLYFAYSLYNSDVVGVMHKLSLAGYILGKAAKGLVFGVEYGASGDGDIEALLLSVGMGRSFNILPGRLQLPVTATLHVGGLVIGTIDTLAAGISLESGVKLRISPDFWISSSLGVSKYKTIDKVGDDLKKEKVDLSQQFVRFGVEVAF